MLPLKISQCQYCGIKDIKQRSSRFFDQADTPEIQPFVTRIECCKYQCTGYGRKQVPLPQRAGTRQALAQS